MERREWLDGVVQVFKVSGSMLGPVQRLCLSVDEGLLGTKAIWQGRLDIYCIAAWGRCRSQ